MRVTKGPSRAALEGCEHEQIHIPGTIQPHGVLLVVDERFTVVQCSANVEAMLGLTLENALGSDLQVVVGDEASRLIREALAQNILEYNPLFLDTTVIGHSKFNLLLHRHADQLIVELELTDKIARETISRSHSGFSRFIRVFERSLSFSSLLTLAADEVRKLTNFDRVLIYQFGPDWTGNVVAESRNERLPSYMDLRFPESDIPRQARDLYRLNRIRFIADADYLPVPILPTLNPNTGKTLDLTFSWLRSVSPVHLEYMKNMGTLASMSISIVFDDKLWGLISCHNRAPTRVDVEVRFACELMGQVLASQLVATKERISRERGSQLQASQHALLTRMSQTDSFTEAIISNPVEMLECTGAEGAAILFENRCERIGRTPSESQVRELAAWISGQPEREVFATNELPRHFPPGYSFRNTASGVLAISISEVEIGYLLWFRPEQSTEVKWAGNPSKIQVAVDGRIHPRKSFQLWTEYEQGRSKAWDAAEVESAFAFRGAVINLVLRKAQKVAALSNSLQQSNAELESFSYSVSHDLRAPFRHIIGYAEIVLADQSLTGKNRRYLDTIVESANYAGLLVDNLLNFARVGRSELNLAPVSLNSLMKDVLQTVSTDTVSRDVQWAIGPLPEVTGDRFLLRLVLENLLRNALKYTRVRERAHIQIDVSAESSNQHVIFVKDNGIGFDMRYADKLFGVFQRLHRQEDYEGTGIGLAIVRRIVGRHGGRVWADGKTGAGATFFFSLPRHVSGAA